MSIIISKVHNGWGFMKRLINPNKQILLFMKLRNCSQNWATINFSRFSKLALTKLFESLLHFRKSKLGVTSLFLMKLSFSQNQIFNEKRKLYAIFLVVLCLTSFLADITLITLLLSQTYVCTSSYRVFNVSGRKRWHQQKV